ncbi:helix-turn-helix transcriptional regulator [Magnetovibrio sp. PR-2]|uniref:response regulator transcription factor n=1 Tax=Magnetovibrio sp. PR-2 TaxID=3120356 RepID=UPI002FCE31AA
MGMQIRELTKQLHRAEVIEQCWNILAKACTREGLLFANMFWRGRVYTQYPPNFQTSLTHPHQHTVFTFGHGTKDVLNVTIGDGRQRNYSALNLDFDVWNEVVEALYHRLVEIGETQDLTPRELQCLHLIAQGNTSKDISEIIGISLPGVNFHVRNATHKLNAKSRTHAVALAMAAGIIGL